MQSTRKDGWLRVAKIKVDQVAVLLAIIVQRPNEWTKTTKLSNRIESSPAKPYNHNVLIAGAVTIGNNQVKDLPNLIFDQKMKI